jgi:hypothetical protein
VVIPRRRLLAWRRRQQGPRPQSVRPAGEVRPPVSEWAWLSVMAIAVGTGTYGWPAWVLRVVGVLGLVGFVVARIRYRVRRGEAVWLWDRI